MVSLRDKNLKLLSALDVLVYTILAFSLGLFVGLGMAHYERQRYKMIQNTIEKVTLNNTKQQVLYEELQQSFKEDIYPSISVLKKRELKRFCVIAAMGGKFNADIFPVEGEEFYETKIDEKGKKQYLDFVRWTPDSLTDSRKFEYMSVAQGINIALYTSAKDKDIIRGNSEIVVKEDPLTNKRTVSVSLESKGNGYYKCLLANPKLD